MQYMMHGPSSKSTMRYNFFLLLIKSTLKYILNKMYNFLWKLYLIVTEIYNETQ